MASPRRVETFLLDGTLESVRIIDIESTLKAIIIPRLALGKVKDLPEVTRPGIYFLIDTANKKVYIGEAEGSYDRLKRHFNSKNKDWWTIAVLMAHVEQDKLGKSDVKYLEALAISRAQKSSYTLLNKNTPKPNTISKTHIHTLDNYLKDIEFSLAFLGHNVLKIQGEEHTEDTWYCTNKSTKARGVTRGEQFIILAGSKIDISHSPTWAKANPNSLRARNKILQEKAEIVNGVATLRDDVEFSSANQATRFAVGHSANAWITWKNAASQTMDEVKRRSE